MEKKPKTLDEIYAWLAELHKKHPPFDPSRWIPPSWKGTFVHEGVLYRITGVYYATKQPIYDFKLPNRPWSNGYIGRQWQWFNHLEKLPEEVKTQSKIS